MMCIYVLITLFSYDRQHRDVNWLLIINTYVALLLWDLIHVFMNLHAILGDQQLYISVDSLACRIQRYIYLYAVLWLFSNFVLQSIFRMLNIVYAQRVQWRSRKKTCVPIVRACFVSLAIVMPTFFLRNVVYKPTEYQCVGDLTVWQANVYMLCAFYLILMVTIVAIYTRVIKYVRQSSVQTQQAATSRDLVVLQRILFLVTIQIPLGFPLSGLWFFLGIAILLLTFATALTNTQVRRILPLFKQRRVTRQIAVHPQSERLEVVQTNTFNTICREEQYLRWSSARTQRRIWTVSSLASACRLASNKRSVNYDV